jgi:putative Holliday junction resolvase
MSVSLKRTMGIDLGDKRIGVAISDPLGISAQGLKTIQNEGPLRTFPQVLAVIKERTVGTVVVGLPLMMSGEVGERAKKVLDWVEELKKQAPECEVVTSDERLTSVEAQRLMIRQGLSRKKQKENSDELSAILILQNYLDSRRPSAPYDPAEYPEG